MLKEKKTNSPDNKSEVSSDLKMLPFEFSMTRFHEFSDDISIIQKFSTTVKKRLFTRNYIDFTIRRDLEVDPNLSEQLSAMKKK